MSSYVYVCIIATLAILVAGCVADQPAATNAAAVDGDAAALLIRLQSDITAALEDLDDRLAYAAYDLRETDLSGDDAHAILANLSATDPSIVDCTVSDADATIITVEPAAYRGVEDTEIQNQSHVRHILATKRPMMSEMITVAEDIPATVYRRAHLYKREPVCRVLLHRLPAGDPDRRRRRPGCERHPVPGDGHPDGRTGALRHRPGPDREDDV